MPDKAEMLAAIRQFILEERAKRGIVSLSGPQPEGSCFMMGENHNLLWRELLFTPENLWPLKDEEDIKGMYKEVLKGRRRK